MILNLVQDGLFAAVASIGFASISEPPKQAYLYCAVFAALGHSLRFLLLGLDVHIIIASFLAALLIGVIAVFTTHFAKCPAETCLFPALLPMIPGMYAYRTIQTLLFCLYYSEESVFMHYFYLFVYNGFTCVFIVMGMVIGATISIFLFKNTSFQATR